MAALRKRHSEDVSEIQEPAEEAQATLDFGLPSEPATEVSESQVEAKSEEEKGSESEKGEESGDGHDDHEEHGDARVVVKRRRVVKKSEDGESSSESPSSDYNHRKIQTNNNQNRFNKNQIGRAHV